MIFHFLAKSSKLKAQSSKLKAIYGIPGRGRAKPPEPL